MITQYITVLLWLFYILLYAWLQIAYYAADEFKICSQRLFLNENVFSFHVQGLFFNHLKYNIFERIQINYIISMFSTRWIIASRIKSWSRTDAQWNIREYLNNSSKTGNYILQESPVNNEIFSLFKLVNILWPSVSVRTHRLCFIYDTVFSVLVFIDRKQKHSRYLYYSCSQIKLKKYVGIREEEWSYITLAADELLINAKSVTITIVTDIGLNSSHK